MATSRRLLVALLPLLFAATVTLSCGDNVEDKDDKIMLPRDVIPVQYYLHLHPNITDGKFLYTGSVRIVLNVQKETDLIVLHSVLLTHKKTTVVELKAEGRKGGAIEVSGTTFDKKYQKAIIQLGSKLAVGKKYVVSIDFLGELRAALEGFYRSSYVTKDGQKKYIATTHMEPVGARKAFPCFDEPDLKAKFKISLVRESIHTALSNMPVEEEKPLENGLVVNHFQESVRMSTYLVAFVVCDFVSLSGKTKRGIDVKVWAPKDQISQAQYAIEIAPKILDHYEDFFNVKFPLPKQDLIAIPDFGAGAMENWGLITYRLTALLYDEKESSSSNKQRVAVVIAHEMAHQWFGNLVTMKWWNDLWLNEGFAAFVEYIGTRHVSPNWRMMDQFVTSNVQTAMALDSHLKSHPISVPVHNPSEIGALFDKISYQKGSSVIRMMRDFIGKQNFVHGLTNYLNRFSYSNAASDDLWAELSKATGKKAVPVKAVMDTWTTQMGYPLVTVHRHGAIAVLTQERFITDLTDLKEANENGAEVATHTQTYKWSIPLTWYYQESRGTKRRWFNVSDQSVVIPLHAHLGWIKINVNEIGFYRVNYDLENWKALAKQLNRNLRAINGADRANLIDDAFQIAKVGKIPHDIALSLTEYLDKEDEYVPWVSAEKSLEYIGKLLRSRKGYATYEKYLLTKVLPGVKRLGWEDTGSHVEKMLRSILLGLAVDHDGDSAVETAKQMFGAWMVDGKAIPPNLRSVVYQAGLKAGGEKEWNFLFKKYQHSMYPSEKKRIIYSLASTTNATLLQRYLTYAIDKTVIRPADTMFVFVEVGHNPVGGAIARGFLNNHWSILEKRYHSSFTTLGRILKGVFSGGKTKEDLKAAETFMKRHDIMKTAAKLSAQQALANIKNNINWLKDNEDNVVSWLHKKVTTQRREESYMYIRYLERISSDLLREIY